MEWWWCLSSSLIYHITDVNRDGPHLCVSPAVGESSQNKRHHLELMINQQKCGTSFPKHTHHPLERLIRQSSHFTQFYPIKWKNAHNKCWIWYHWDQHVSPAPGGGLRFSSSFWKLFKEWWVIDVLGLQLFLGYQKAFKCSMILWCWWLLIYSGNVSK